MNNAVLRPACGAQNGFLRAVGLALAKFNAQVNAIARNYVRNASYYPDDLIDQDKFSKHRQQLVPSRRVAESRETAKLALYLAGPWSTHIVGQILPFAGVWTTTVQVDY